MAAFYDGRLHTTRNSDRSDCRFLPLLNLIPSINKKSLLMRDGIDENAFNVASYWNLLRKLICLSKLQQHLFEFTSFHEILYYYSRDFLTLRYYSDEWMPNSSSNINENFRKPSFVHVKKKAEFWTCFSDQSTNL